MKPSNRATYFRHKITSSEVAYLLIALGVAMRLLPHAPNITPLGALAIWGGIRLHPKLSFWTLLAVLVISDFLIGFHDTMPYVYGSLLVVAWIASRIKKVTLWSVGMATVIGALLFFLITNFGVWYVSRFHSVPMYPPTLDGLFQSYVAGLPFLRASLTGDILYTATFFGLEVAVLTVLANQRIVKNVLTHK